MNLFLICVGKVDKQLNELILDYSKRINYYTHFKIIEIKNENDTNKNRAIDIESEKIIKYFPKNSYFVLLDIFGKGFSSLEFADFIAKKQLCLNKNLVFIIGGSNGVNNNLKTIVDTKISFSKMTYPHQIIRVVFVEQIYRALNINNNGKYHK